MDYVSTFFGGTYWRFWHLNPPIIQCLRRNFKSNSGIWGTLWWSTDGIWHPRIGQLVSLRWMICLICSGKKKTCSEYFWIMRSIYCPQIKMARPCRKFTPCLRCQKLPLRFNWDRATRWQRMASNKTWFNQQSIIDYNQFGANKIMMWSVACRMYKMRMCDACNLYVYIHVYI